MVQSRLGRVGESLVLVPRANGLSPPSRPYVGAARWTTPSWLRRSRCMRSHQFRGAPTGISALTSGTTTMVLWPSGDYSPKLTTTPGYFSSDAIPTEARMKLRRPQRTGWGRRLSVGLTAAVVAPMILVAFAGTAQAAKSAGCENGGFSLKTLPGTVPAATFVTATA